MPELNWTAVLKSLTDMREELRMLNLRAEQREEAYNAMLRTLTGQMVQVAAGIEQRLDRIEGLMTDIARKLDG